MSMSTGVILLTVVNWSIGQKSVPAPHCLTQTSHRLVCECLLCSRNCICTVRVILACLSPGKTGFDPGSHRVRFVVDEVALGQFFFPLSTSIFPCHYPSINGPYPSSSRRTKRRILGTFVAPMIFGMSAALDTQLLLHLTVCNWMWNRCLTNFQKRVKNINSNIWHLYPSLFFFVNPHPKNRHKHIRKTDCKKGKVKGEIHPITCHEGIEGE